MSTKIILALGAGLAVGGAVGFLAGVASSDSEVAALSGQLETARGELTERAAEFDMRLAEATAKRRDRPRAAPADTAVAEASGPDAPAAAGSTEESATDEGVEPGMTAAERAARVTSIRGDIDVWFDRGDGEALIQAMQELAGLAPEGRQAAMELAVRINEDVNGPGKLEIGQVTFYSGFGDPAVRGLMDWSLDNREEPDNEALQGFRVMSVWSLPWTQPAEKTVAQFAEVLRTEKNVDVQRGLVMNLARMRNPEGNAALAATFNDPTRDALLRAQIATQLAMSDDPEIVRSIEAAAQGDADPRVRDASRAVLVARDPPKSGYLVTGTLPESVGEASGVRAGDIVLSYNGASTRDGRSLQQATSSVDKEVVEVVVFRDGEEVRMNVPAGALGVFGRGVAPKVEAE